GAIVVALAVVGVAARAVDGRPGVRIEPQHFVIVGDRLVVLTEIGFAAGADEISERRLRRELDRALGGGDGALRLLGDGPEIGPVDMGFRVVRGDLDGLIKILLRLFEIAFESEDEAALRIGGGEQAPLRLSGFDHRRTSLYALVGAGCRPEAKLPRIDGR